MRNIIALVAATMLLCNTAYPCEMCGSGSNGQYIGMLPAFNRNVAGLQYFIGSNSGKFPSAYSGRPDENTSDFTNTFRLWCRQRIGKQYSVFVFLPYQYNVRYKEGNTRQENNGIGDISFLVNRVFLDRSNDKWKHALYGGVGIKLPTGKYVAYYNVSETVPAMTPGTGSYDFIANVNNTVRHNNTGVNIEAAYTATTPSADNYKYGNKVNAGLAIVYTVQWGRVSLVPQAGARYEYAANDYYNYDKKWLNDASGGHVVYGVAGIQAAYKNVGARLVGQLPIQQRLAGGEVTTNYKVETGFFILY